VAIKSRTRNLKYFVELKASTSKKNVNDMNAYFLWFSHFNFYEIINLLLFNGNNDIPKVQ
jgi:hypothetical protein